MSDALDVKAAWLQRVLGVAIPASTASRLNELNAALIGLAKRIPVVAAANPAAREGLLALAVSARDKINVRDPEAASVDIDRLNAALAAAERARQAPAPTSETAAEVDREPETGVDPTLPQQLDGRIRDIINQLNNVAPEDRATLVGQAKQAHALVQGVDLLAAEIAVEELEDDYLTAVRAARNAEAKAMTRDAVTYRKLRNAWQAAQAQALTELEGLADAVVNDPEENEDDADILDDVVAAANRIGDVLPRFGTELETILADAELEPDDARRNKLRAAAAAKADEYIGELQGADVLAALQAFADEEYGSYAPLRTLRDTLGALVSQLRKQPAT
jgi:DNA-directed RNA polymerase subunit F